MRVAIFGAGAIGAYFGGRLAESAHDVVFVARGDQLRALREDGLTLRTRDGERRIPTLQVDDDPRNLGTVDAVLLGVKAWQVPDAARSLGPLLAPETCVLPLQNGVDAPGILTGIIGDRPVLGGTCKIICKLARPGVVEHLGVEPTIAMGELDNRSSRRTRRLAELLNSAGIRAEIPDDIHRVVWEKFLFISAVSGVGAVTRASVGTMRTVPETRELLRRAMDEVERVARADGVALAEDIVDRTMAFLDGLPPDSSASMQRDIVAGRPSELEYQNGAVVRLGRERGVPTPVHTFLYQSLLPLELRARHLPLARSAG